MFFASLAKPILTVVLLLLLTAPWSLVAQEQDDVRGTPAEPDDAAEIRAQISQAQDLLGKLPIAAPFFISWLFLMRCFAKRFPPSRA